MSHNFLKCLVFSYIFLYTHWVYLPGIGIGIGLEHVHTQDSWYRSWIIFNIKTTLGIGLDKNEKSRHLLVLVSKNVSFQDLSWYWSWNKNDIKISLGLGLEQKRWSHRTLLETWVEISTKAHGLEGACLRPWRRWPCTSGCWRDTLQQWVTQSMAHSSQSALGVTVFYILVFYSEKNSWHCIFSSFQNSHWTKNLLGVVKAHHGWIKLQPK